MAGRVARMGATARAVRVARTAAASPGDIWRWLADPHSYAEWVSGTTDIRRADPEWPAVGAHLEHRFGPWPIRVRDHTVVLGCDPPRRIVLAASALPWGTVWCEITLAPVGEGTRVELCERLTAGIGAWLRLPARLVQRRRNRRSLERLIELAERR